MGWQCHSSGSAYNSLSGHALLIGTNSRKFFPSAAAHAEKLQKETNSKAVPKDSEPVGIWLTKDKDHRCHWNIKGSSKSMELQSAVALITDLYDSGISFAIELVIDDGWL